MSSNNGRLIDSKDKFDGWDAGIGYRLSWRLSLRRVFLVSRSLMRKNQGWISKKILLSKAKQWTDKIFFVALGTWRILHNSRSWAEVWIKDLPIPYPHHLLCVPSQHHCTCLGLHVCQVHLLCEMWLMSLHTSLCQSCKSLSWLQLCTFVQEHNIHQICANTCQQCVHTWDKLDIMDDLSYPCCSCDLLMNHHVLELGTDLLVHDRCRDWIRHCDVPPLSKGDRS
jgi:hypothetical protein